MASRRLIDDQLYDREGSPLRGGGCTLRIRRDGRQGILTFKGPGRGGPVKSREEVETPVDDVDALERIVTELGYTPFFRAQKFREEYELDGPSAAADVSAVPSPPVRLTIDETPMGIFVEIESVPEAIAMTAVALGRTTDDYILESYQRLFAAWATAHGQPGQAMLVKT